MAAVTPSTTTQRASRADLAGTGFRVHRFASVGNGDEWASGKTGVIACVAGNADKNVRVAFSDGVFSFTVTSGPATDLDLYVWGPDY